MYNKLVGKYWEKYNVEQFIRCIDQWNVQRTLRIGRK